MGAYLSEPVTEKCSSDETNDYIDVGASSMQGWRVSQEDAHNCILSYDENTSLFAVYDGHGGAEVATYCAEKLPDFLKKLKAYKDGDFEQALKDAFLGFDATLLEDDVIATLKRLAGEKNPDECSEIEEEEEDLNELCEEGALPLDQVLEKYKGCVQKFPHIYKLKLNEASGSGTSKPMSPFLRGRQSDSGSSTCHDVATPSSSSTLKKSPNKTLKKRSLDVEPEADSMVSSSSGVSESLPSQSHHEGDGGGGDIDNDKSNEPTNSTTKNGTILKCSSPDSSSAASAKKIPSTKTEVCTPSTGQSKSVDSVNGEVVGSSSSASPSSDHQENEVSTNSPSKKEEAKTESASCSSSTSTASESTRSTKQENGEVSSYSAEATKGSLIEKIRLDFGTSPSKISSSTNEETKEARRTGEDEDDSSSDDDMDFQAEEENSSTEDGDADCESCDEEETEEEDEEPIDPESEDMYRNMIDEPGKDSGCTAVVALINGRDLFVANAGDSRCVVCRNGKAVDMSIDHKPEDKDESKRIMEAGGNVTLDGRVNGGLNLSRALGDHAYKMNKDLPAEKQMISALPDVRKLAILPEDEFMILACDGIWNFMSSDEVVEFVKKRLDEGQTVMSKICEELFTNCLAPTTFGDGTGCDNMTAVLVRFKPTINSLQSKILFDSEAIPAVQSKKRAADDESNDSKEAKVENTNKRQKTDESDSSQQVTTCGGKSAEGDTNGNDDVQMSSTTDSNSIHQNTTATTS